MVKKDTLTAYPEQLVKYIKKYFNGAKVNTVYEAGFSGFYLHRYLLSQGINNIVVHPASIKVSARDRVKTDKRDSLKMAKQLSNGELKCIKIPSEKREFFRILTRTREQLVDNKKRVGNQLKSLLFTQGLIDPQDDMKVSKTWIKKIQQLQLAEEVKYSVDLFIQLWVDLDAKLQEILKKLHKQAETDAVDVIYPSVPGIGALSARILANELEDMKHFHNEKGLFSYTGLTPSEYSSGEHKHLGSISRQGKAALRMILVQIAWRSIQKDKRLLEVFERISKKAGKKRAIVAVARKIVGCIRACFMTGTIWCANAPDRNKFLTRKAEAC
ncbi:IS110 family transposase [Dolichospermum sp. ST_sed3]|nr:IS110 family transposase [Dolichospermum sp. ST_sed3]